MKKYVEIYIIYLKKVTAVIAKEGLDNYIEETTKKVEKIIQELMGE